MANPPYWSNQTPWHSSRQSRHHVLAEHFSSTETTVASDKNKGRNISSFATPQEPQNSA